VGDDEDTGEVVLNGVDGFDEALTPLASNLLKREASLKYQSLE